MTPPTHVAAYREAAERHLQAAEILNDAGLSEIAIFHCYHAFESIVSAALASYGRQIPNSHHKKINSFTNRFRSRGFALGASALATDLEPLRNMVLYPTGGLPSQMFTKGDADRRINRVKGIIGSVRANLGI